MSEKVKYSCKSCGWTTSIRAEWADMRPKRCMHKKCNTSFIANPEALEVTLPTPATEAVAVEAPQMSKKQKKKQNEEQDSE